MTHDELREKIKEKIYQRLPFVVINRDDPYYDEFTDSILSLIDSAIPEKRNNMFGAEGLQGFQQGWNSCVQKLHTLFGGKI